MTDLGDVGKDPAYASDVNNGGVITGSAGLAKGGAVAPMHAYIYRDGVMYDIGRFAGPGAGSSLASAINEAGHVVGTAFGGAGEERAFLWRDNIMYNLGTLAGTSSGAEDINAAGQIVGQSDGAAFFVRSRRDAGLERSHRAYARAGASPMAWPLTMPDKYLRTAEGRM